MRRPLIRTRVPPPSEARVGVPRVRQRAHGKANGSIRTARDLGRRVAAGTLRHAIRDSTGFPPVPRGVRPDRSLVAAQFGSSHAPWRRGRSPIPRRRSVTGESVDAEADDMSGCADADSGGRASESEHPSHELQSGTTATTTSAPETASTSTPSFSLELPALKHVKDLIVLSFFDGMGSGAYALQQLGIRIRALFTWEVDTPSNRVSKSVFKGLRFERGDIAQDDAATVAGMLRDMDADGVSPLLVLAGPPCPDYSRVAHGLGRSGPTGQLFQVFTDFLASLERELPQHRFHILVENVVMNRREDADYFSKALKASPALLCASDFGVISRPRLFWTRLDFAQVKQNPVTGKPIRWAKQSGYPRLHTDAPKDDIGKIQMKGLRFHEEVRSGRKLLPCLTTPADSDAGREAPKSLKGPLEPSVKKRWLEANRQYAPWHYADTAMVVATTGEQTTLPAEIKEQCHHFHSGITRLQNVSPRDRHRMLGNSWHVGIVKFLVWLLLSQVAPAQSSLCEPDFGSADMLGSIMHQATLEPLSVSRELPTSRFLAIPPSDQEWEHWLATAEVQHPLLAPPQVSKAIEMVYKRLHAMGDEIHAFRASVLKCLEAFVQENKPSSDEWYHSLSSHVKAAYATKNSPGYLQIPVFISLLRGCHYPEVDLLEAELSGGMPMIGRIRPTSGWLPRTDGKYSEPISLESFRRLNANHAQERLRKPRIDEEWQVMLAEIMTEVNEGRMEGPFEAPASWSRKTVAVAGSPGFQALLPLPDAEPCIAWAFSVVQEGSDGKRKVRRCEDYRRSFHNDTVEAFDTPPHDDISVYVSMIRHLRFTGRLAFIWAQDLESAYRQYPVAEPAHCYVVVMTPDGPTLWRHRVMPFGATASVFHFNKVTDALLWLARTLLHVPVIHYADDLGSVDPQESASSSFGTFDSFCNLLGFRLKHSKRQPPGPVQKLQGVIVSIGESGVTVSPSPSRVAKLTLALQKAVSNDFLSADEASRLAGKLGFLASSLWGQSGSSLLRPLYGRAQGSKDGENHLNSGLRACMQCILHLLASPVPRFLPFAQEDVPTTVMYADAFFKLGDDRWSVSSDSLPTRWPSNMHLAENGWGFVCRFPNIITAGHGRVPPSILSLFGARRSFIYFLEIFSQAICLLTNHKRMTPFWISFCDNRAGLTALQKGYGRDEHVNRMLSWFHALNSRLRWHGHFQWVSSEANISDKVSRGDLTTVQSQGWASLQSGLEGFWPILERIASDSLYAVGEGVEAALALEWQFATST